VIHVAQVNVVQPRKRVEPERLLDDWPTLGDIATATHRAGANVSVFQAFHRNAEIVRDQVAYRFVADPCLPGRVTGLRPGRLARAVREAAPDVIHLNGLDFARHARALCRTGIPVLVQDHASIAGAGGWRRRRGLRDIAGAAFTSSDQGRAFIEAGELRTDTQIFAVPESSTHFIADGPAAADMPGNPVVLWVGRLDANKDPLTILDAIELATRELPRVQLYCCFHDQPLLAEVRTRIEQSSYLAKRVYLIGRMPHAEIESRLRAADFFMLGSHREGSGYALIEALACGATPIVTDIAPFRALAGPIGALVPPGDAKSFADALVSLAARPRAELRQQAIARFESALSFDRVGARLCEIYEIVVRRGA
jgi:glycosyltransferase involved in cell wall biosynthesis